MKKVEPSYRWDSTDAQRAAYRDELKAKVDASRKKQADAVERIGRLDGEAKCEAVSKYLTEKFPRLWAKPGQEFGKNQPTCIWSGEGSVMPDGQEAFCGYSYDIDPEETVWQMGVHKDLVAALAAIGYHAEAYDGGTYFFYFDGGIPK